MIRGAILGNFINYFLKMSNRKLSVDVLLELRKKVVYAVVYHDVKKTVAAKLFGFSLTSVLKYVREFELKGERSFDYKKRGVKESARCFLSAAQIASFIKDPAKSNT